MTLTAWDLTQWEWQCQIIIIVVRAEILGNSCMLLASMPLSSRHARETCTARNRYKRSTCWRKLLFIHSLFAYTPSVSAVFKHWISIWDTGIWDLKQINRACSMFSQGYFSTLWHGIVFRLSFGFLLFSRRSIEMSHIANDYVVETYSGAPGSDIDKTKISHKMQRENLNSFNIKISENECQFSCVSIIK